MEIKELTPNDFEEIIYDNCEPCCVIFTRKSCHVCQQVEPMLEEMMGDYKDRFGFYAVDVEDQVDLFKRFTLKGVPQILFFNDGDYKGKLAGEVEMEQVAEKIESVL